VKLELQGVDYLAGTQEILRDVNLDLESGTCCVLLGPNGAGKSTLMRLASGYEQPTNGKVLLDGRALTSLSLAERARHLAVLTQRNSLDFPFTAAEVIAMGRTPYGIPSLDRAGETIVDALNIDVDRVYTQLSGGEKQLVQLARIFSQVWERGPDACLLLDEPMTALDLKHQKDVLGLLRKFSREGTSQMIVMHDINLAAEVADVIVLMSGGQLMGIGPAPEVLTPEALERTFQVPMAVLQDGPERFYKTVIQEQ